MRWERATLSPPIFGHPCIIPLRFRNRAHLPSISLSGRGDVVAASFVITSIDLGFYLLFLLPHRFAPASAAAAAFPFPDDESIFRVFSSILSVTSARSHRSALLNLPQLPQKCCH